MSGDPLLFICFEAPLGGRWRGFISAGAIVCGGVDVSCYFSFLFSLVIAEGDKVLYVS